MKHSIRTYVLASALCGVFATSAATFAMGHRGGDSDPSRMLEHMSDRLELTENQHDEIEQIFASAREQTAEDRARLDELRNELQAMRPDFDPGRAQAIADEIGQITARMAYGMASTQAQVYQQLDAQQREEYDQMAASRDKRRDKFRDHWRGR